ncbi:MraY family glycosyltransferase [Helcobacillus massiliensis]|uniref:UDP-GlcNAc:undecaprenyl-phosphate GlcNAc-1-phosphate transferase n=1 Tax=Helcobacillus massiliensis TaxID=521392 RepID=A0A839R104_9MICO|nr:UDP-GlcNAc:undecaprenyl-phosphate GlcNAc-1-phosphate transferase [Helcobacillus massiliensis]
MRVYLFLLLVSAAVTFLATPAARLVARRFGAMTAVRQRDVHKDPTPRLGGVAMFAGVAVAMLIASRTKFLAPLFAESFQAWAILIAAGMICLLGALDDKWDLDWVTKLAGQALIAFFLAWQGVQLASLPIGGVTLLSPRSALILTAVVIIGCMNAVNFVDGLDGLASGVMAIGGGAFFLYAYILTRDSSSTDFSSLAALIAAVMIGACLGFLPHNFSKARIFMGDSGALLLGLLLSAATIAVTGQVDPAQLSTVDVFGQFLPILLPIGVMIVPLLDMVLAVIRRVGSGKSPFHADRMHLHHRLLEIGHSKVGAVLIMYLWTVVVCAILLAPVFFTRTIAVSVAVIGLLAAIVLTADPLSRIQALRARKGQHERR